MFLILTTLLLTPIVCCLINALDFRGSANEHHFHEWKNACRDRGW